MGTPINACDAGLWLDTHAGVPTDIGGSSNEVNMSFESVIGETKVFGNDWKIRLSCGADAEFACVATYTTAGSEAFALLKEWWFTYRTELRTVSVYLPDKNVGSDHYEGEFLLKDLKIPAKSNDANPIAVSFTLLPSGAVTLETNAT
jgi:hypothetical protein